MEIQNLELLNNVKKISLIRIKGPIKLHLNYLKKLKRFLETFMNKNCDTLTDFKSDPLFILCRNRHVKTKCMRNSERKVCRIFCVVSGFAWQTLTKVMER